MALLTRTSKAGKAAALLLALMLGLSACGGSTTKDGDKSEAPAAEAPAGDNADDKGGDEGSDSEAGSGEIVAAPGYGIGGSFDPATTSGAVTLGGNWHTMEGLTEIDPTNGEVYAALAKEMPKAIDDKTYEVTLRDGAVFHNGDKVTADDVLFSYKRVMDNTDGFYDDFINFIDKVEKKDDTTVTFHLKQPFSLINNRLSIVKIVPQKVVEADAEAFGLLPVGTGPWKYTKATPKEAIVFERNDAYTGPRPAKAAKMTWNLLDDPTARVTALRDGSVSVIESVPATDKATLENDFSVESVDSFGLAFMLFNTKQKPWDNVKARQALFYALDIETLIKDYLGGDAAPVTGFLQESHPNYQKASTVYTYDVDKAKALLKEAGVEEGHKVVLRIAESWIKPMAPAIQEQLQAAGLKVDLRVMPSKALYPEIDAGDNEVVIAPGDPSVFGSDPDLLMRWWYGANVWSKSRYAWSESPEFANLTKILDEATTLSGDEQAAKWKEAYDLIAEQVPLYPLMHRKVPTAWDPEAIDNFKPVGMTGLYFLGANAK